MKKLLLFWFLFFAYNSISQSWVKKFAFNTQAAGWISKVISLSDSTYIFCGSMNQTIYLIKVDKEGNFIWNKKYNSKQWGEAVADIKQTKNNELILTGWTQVKDSTNNAHSMDVLILKLDLKGNVKWSKHYNLKNGYQYNDMGYCIQETSDLGFIVTGTTTGFNTTGTSFIMKLDSIGNLMWDKTFWLDRPKVIQLEDKGYLITGDLQNYSGVKILKFDSSGNLLWNNLYSDSSYLKIIGNDIIELPNGNIGILCFSDPSDVLIFIIDNEGEIKWSKAFDSGMREIGYSGIYHEGKYTIAGWAYFPGEIDRPFLMQIDKEGNLIWANKSLAANVNGHYSNIQSFKNGFILSGREDLSLCLTSTNKSGEIACQTPMMFNVKDINMTISIAPNQLNSGMASYTYSVYQTDTIILDSTLCKCEVTAGCTIYETSSLKINFINSSNNGINYFWDFGDNYTSTEINPQHIYQNLGTYKISLTAYSNNCSSTYEAFLNIEPKELLYPNIFTPNNDGTNDIFTISNLPERSSFEIYNRWGIKQYTSTTLNNSTINNNSWDGRTTSGQECPEGVYYYIATLPDNKNYKGFVHLLR